MTITTVLEEQNVTRTTTTNDQGYYNLQALPVGTYTITAELAGFKRYVQTGVVLTVNQNVRLDIQLELGDIADSVTVSAEPPLVDTRSATISGLVDDRRVVDLPLAGRNVIALAGLLPGVSNVRAPSPTDLTDARSGPVMNVNGGRANQNFQTFNGAYFNQPSRNTGLNLPPPDAVKEFRILTANFSPEYGRNPGAVINVVAKSGTNAWRGSVWEFHRNSVLNARSFFEGSRPQQRQNQFGFASGGPLVKNKIFILGTYEGMRDRREASAVDAFPPTTAELAGDFSDRTRPLMNPFTGQPFPGNRVPASLFDPAAVKLLQFLPPVPPGVRLTSLASAPRDADQFMIRNDWNWSPKSSFFAHYYLSDNSRNEALGASNVPGWMGRTIGTRAQSAAFNHTYTFSSTVLNQFIFGFTRSSSLTDNTTTRLPAELGILMPMYTPTGSPQLRVTGRFNLNASSQTRFVAGTFHFADGLSWTYKRHTFKIGTEIFRFSNLQSFLGPPAFSFTGVRSGDALLDFLLGAYRNLGLGFGVRRNDTRQNFLSWYFQDEFKITPRLSLTYGVRYELPRPWYDVRDRIDTIVFGAQSKVDPAAPPWLLFPGDLRRSLAEPDNNNWAPRIGFAYDPFGDGKMSIRLAYGVFYDSYNADVLAQENQPFAGNAQFFNGKLSDPFGSIGAAPPPVTPGVGATRYTLPMAGFFIDTKLRTPYVQEWNLAVQRQIASDLTVQAAYVGKTGRKLLAFKPWNPARFIPGVDEQGRPRSTLENVNERVLFLPGIYQAFSNVIIGNDFTNHYHSFQLEVNKRFTRGLSVLGSYTLGKSLDSSSTTTLGAFVSNPFNIRDDKGRSSFDRRHVFALSWLWSPEYGGDGLRRQVLGGWTFAAITLAQSGVGLELFSGDDVALDGTGGDQHPLVVGDPRAVSRSNREAFITQFFNTRALALPPPGTYGNAARGILSGPAFVNHDFAVLKDIRVREPRRLQLRTEFFNIFNQVNFGNPVVVLLNRNFGRILGAGSGRAIQFGLKFLW